LIAISCRVEPTSRRRAEAIQCGREATVVRLIGAESPIASSSKL
jgi:hypothetical protein